MDEGKYHLLLDKMQVKRAARFVCCAFDGIVMWMDGVLSALS